jgi:3-deoxy-D-manno-octulosonate 8-phosphate phosphatase (KDO 8-P phosphatase)
MMKNIKHLVYDFDGVMTDNRVLVDQDGKEAVFVNRSDGLAVGEIKKLGLTQIIVSTERNSVVGARAKKLGLPVVQSVEDKAAAVRQYAQENNYRLEETAFIGNDLNDLEAMRLVGWPIAPADAQDEVKKIAKVVLQTKGGYGVVREILAILEKEKQ